MSITLELTPQEEELLTKAAQETGQSVGAFLKERAFRGLDWSSQPESASETSEATWQRLSLAGKAAGIAAKNRASAIGSGVVYAKDGAVVEETSDGERTMLHLALPDRQ